MDFSSMAFPEAVEDFCFLIQKSWLSLYQTLMILLVSAFG